MSAVTTKRRAVLKLGLSVCAVAGLSACQGFTPPRFGQRGGDTNPLSNEVRQALRNHPDTSGILIDVFTTGEGNIRLIGTVNTDLEYYAAETVASGVAGVIFVHNNIVVRE
ncbi:MAG: BON domain-containing protein [Gammaproteobacteria bacterium]|nr:BON domain-containing protein [Gammaproteobacteria bacterium]